MPLKKFTHADIVEAAFNITRKRGWEKCTARAIAKELGSSTMPIYSALKSMKNLENQIDQKAIDLLLSFQTRQRTGMVFLDMGVGYVLFAQEEKNLFRKMYFSEIGKDKILRLFNKYRAYIFDQLLAFLKNDKMLKELSVKQKKDVLYRMWVFSHGLAVLLNNARVGPMNETEITKFLMETGSLMISGQMLGILEIK
jgi:hypothetical protein